MVWSVGGSGVIESVPIPITAAICAPPGINRSGPPAAELTGLSFPRS